MGKCRILTKAEEILGGQTCSVHSLIQNESHEFSLLYTDSIGNLMRYITGRTKTFAHVHSSRLPIDERIEVVLLAKKPYFEVKLK